LLIPPANRRRHPQKKNRWGWSFFRCKRKKPAAAQRETKMARERYPGEEEKREKAIPRL
jgi:hypothetical protein